MPVGGMKGRRKGYKTTATIHSDMNRFVMKRGDGGGGGEIGEGRGGIIASLVGLARRRE